MSNGQTWVLLSLLGVLLSVIGALLVAQIRALGDRLDDRFTGLGATMDARFRGLESMGDRAIPAMTETVLTGGRDCRVAVTEYVRRTDLRDRRFCHVHTARREPIGSPRR